MNSAIKKHMPLAFAAVLVLAMIFTLGFSSSGIAAADEGYSAALNSELVVGHVSDVHYFPLQHCYQDVHADDYPDSDFYYSMTGDTKLVLESGMILNANLRRILADARDGKAPVYIFASGDLTKNGEHVALIDVANSFRWLQNQVRALGGKYEGFQIFAVPGNHDLYNGSGALYSTSDGASRRSDGVTAAQFALIFAGLGYPDANLNGDGGAIKLLDVFPESYWSNSGDGSFTDGYIASTNAANLKLTYYGAAMQSIASMQTYDKDAFMSYYTAVGDEINHISYHAEVTSGPYVDYGFFGIDASDRQADGTTVYTEISEAEFRASYNTDSAFKARSFYLLKDGATSIRDGEISAEPAKKRNDVLSAFSSGKPVYVDAGLNHLSGGRLTQGLLNWMRNIASAENAKASSLGEKTLIATYHQNTLPHFDQEDDILKDFVLYNWEYTAKQLLDMGVRYTLTGHMHASDVTFYTDAEGRTLYDIETGSFVSFNSPIRYLTFSRYDCDGKLGERLSSSVKVLERLAGFASSNFIAAAEWNDTAYENAMATYEADPTEANWQAVFAANPDYYVYTLHYEDMVALSFDGYIQKEIYGRLVDRLLDHFLNERLADTLRGLVSGLIDGIDFALLNSYKPLLGKIASYAVEEILTGLYPDGKYPYNGNTYNGAIEYVKAILHDVVSMKFGTPGEELDVADMAAFIMSSHTSGNELPRSIFDAEQASSASASPATPPSIHYDVPVLDPAYRVRFEAALKDFVKQCETGELVQKLLDKILTPLLYNDDSLLKTLLSHKFDFTNAGLSDDDISDFDDLMSLIEMMAKAYAPPGSDFKLEIAVDNFVLGDVVNGILPMLSSLLQSLLGFTLTGDSVLGILQGFLDDYLVESFYVGIGGIAKNIVVAFATDTTPDIASIDDPAKPFAITPYEGYASGYAALECGPLAYVSDVTVPDSVNAATQANGRLPGSLSANFDTVNSTTSFTLSYYTAEDIGTKFELYGNDGSLLSSVDLTTNDLTLNAQSFLAGAKTDGVLTVSTITLPQYIPLIDLGILCIQHTAVYSDEENLVLYNANERDNAPANSVVYWNRHVVTITGLEPGKTYGYKVYGNYVKSDDSVKYFDLAADRGVDKFTLATAPDSSVTEFDFLAVADLQGMVDSMYKTSYEAMAALEGNAATNGYDFILNAGDVVDNGKNFNLWQSALNTYFDVFANTSAFTAPGNHEDGSFALNKFYNYTQPADFQNQSGETGLAYSFDYANAHIVVLDTNDATAAGLGEEQFEWLKADLAASDAKWKFVLMHKSLYSGGAHSTDAEVVAMREQLVPVFAENDVDIVFGGHDHTYTVTELIGADGKKVEQTLAERVTYNKDSVMYVTLGTMGTKFYNYENNDEVTPLFSGDQSHRATLEGQTFGYVSVNGDKLAYTGYMYVDGEIMRIGRVTLSDNPIYIPSSVNADNPDTIYIPFHSSRADADAYNLGALPAGWSAEFVVGDRIFDSIDQITLTKKSVEVSVYVVAPDGGRTLAQEFVLEKKDYLLGVELWLIFAIVLTGAIIVTALWISKKRKTKTKASQTSD